jgi:hypothetical protein
MAYGHAERILATIRRLEAETRELLARQEHLDPEQAEWRIPAASHCVVGLVYRLATRTRRSREELVSRRAMLRRDRTG